MDDGEREDAEIERRSAAMVEGLSHARFGRADGGGVPVPPRILSEEQGLDIVARYERGEDTYAIAAAAGVSVGTIYRSLKRQGVKPSRAPHRHNSGR